MASAYFQNYVKILRRMHMQRLVESLRAEHGGNSRPALIVNPRTGMPVLPAPGELVPRPQSDG